MRLAAKLPEPAFLVKRISYLASDDTDTLFPPCASRFTCKHSGSAFAAETLMDNAG
jgi:hypothetical protein